MGGSSYSRFPQDIKIPVIPWISGDPTPLCAFEGEGIAKPRRSSLKEA